MSARATTLVLVALLAWPVLPAIPPTSDGAAPNAVPTGSTDAPSDGRPWVAVDADGHTHFVFRRSGGSRPGLYYVTNRTGHWGAVRLETGGGANSPELHLDSGGAAHIVWHRGDPFHGNLGLFYATNKGGTWTRIRLLAGDHIHPFASTLDPADHLHVVVSWISGSTAEFRHITNVSGSFKSTAILSGATSYRPGVAISPTGKLLVAYVGQECCTGSRLWFASNRTGSWGRRPVGLAYVPADLNVAQDAGGKIHIYYNETSHVARGVFDVSEASGQWSSNRLSTRFLQEGNLVQAPDGTRTIVGMNRDFDNDTWAIMAIRLTPSVMERMVISDAVEKHDPRAAVDRAGAIHATYISARTGRWGIEYVAPSGDNWRLTLDGSTYVDVAGSFADDILWVTAAGIARGCDTSFYCPTDPVTRGQLATFLVRALGLTGSAPDAFFDDDGTTHEADINRLAAAALTSGCAPDRFCPTAPVLRDQMASFLARAVGLTGTAPDAFSDDDGNTHELSINRVAAAGITRGCSPTTYCPTEVVTRGQMAAFLHRAFDE